jgi:hypothetical protein
MLDLFDISSGRIYNYLLKSQSYCNHIMLILYWPTPCILLIFTLLLIHFILASYWLVLTTELHWLESDMRRTQCCVLLHVTSLRSCGPSLLLRDQVVTA